MARVLITGHATGLGEHLNHYLSTRSFITTGVSRRTGHDIATKEGRDEIIELSMDHLVFINNAWSPDEPNAQILLLDKMYTEWVGDSKGGVIINIGSRAAVEHQEVRSPYSISKELLLQKSDEIAQMRSNDIRVCCLNFGYLDTYQFKDKKVKIPMWHAGRVVEMAIEYGLSSPPIQIRNMTIEAVR